MNYANIVIELKAAKALIDTPAKWVQEYYGTDEDKSDELPEYEWDKSNLPACMCSIGAIAVVQIQNDSFMSFQLAENSETAKFLGEVMGGSVVDYNDSHTHEEVMAKWDEAIKLAETKANQATIVAALRSGKYTQGTHQLKSGNCHCVWGVICDVSGLGEFNANGEYMAKDVYGFTVAPVAVHKWAGLSPTSEVQVGERKGSLVFHNDICRTSFADLADAIESQILQK